jgi:hypothetical protein
MRHRAHAVGPREERALGEHVDTATAKRAYASTLTYLEYAESELKIVFTRGQRIIARVGFGYEDPIDLGDDADLAIAMFGGVERFPRACRRQQVWRLGRGSAKSMMCVTYGLYRLDHADLSMVGPGDEAAVIIVAPLKILSEADVNVGEMIAKNTPSIVKRVKSANTSRVLLERRQDKRRAQLLCVPRSGGGAAARGKSVIDAILDESEFIPFATEESAVRDVDLINAMMPRLIPDGRLFLISTPWPVPSETSRLFKENYGAPKTALVARASTAIMRSEHTHFLDMIALERERDPENARREYDCEETSVAGSFLDFASIEAAVGSIDVTRHCASAGWDLAFTSDSAGSIIVERQRGRVVVVDVALRTPGRSVSLRPSEVVLDFAARSVAYQCFVAGADQWYILSAREHAATLGVSVAAGPTHAAWEIAMCYMRDVFRNRKITIPADQMLIDQLRSITCVPRSGGGMQITLPRRIGLGHADLVPALCNAVWLDRRYGPITGVTMGVAQGWGAGFQTWR